MLNIVPNYLSFFVARYMYLNVSSTIYQTSKMAYRGFHITEERIFNFLKNEIFLYPIFLYSYILIYNISNACPSKTYKNYISMYKIKF